VTRQPPGREPWAQGPSDLEASSGEPVTQAQVKQAAAQADALPDATGGSRWQFVGPSNVGGRVTDLAMGLSADHSSLFVAKYGRGVYQLPLTTTATGNGGDATGPSAGGTVPATLALSLGQAASFGAFTPGAGQDYDASTTADVLSTAGNATLSVADPDTAAPGHLTNGSFALAQPLQAQASGPAAGPGGAFAPISGNPLALLTWSAPVSHDPVGIAFRQTIGVNDPLRSGSYGKTLTFTLSTTTP
jgi:hypothetical protein